MAKKKVAPRQVLVEAEMKARAKEIERAKVLTDEEMEYADELLEKAQKRRMLLVPEKKVKNRTRFVQLLQRNIEYLRQHDYLTSEEKVFLFDIQPFIGLHSNAIVDDPKKKESTPVNISQLAKMLQTSRPKVSRIVNALVDKGIMAKAESGIDGFNGRSYSMFLNPNVIFCGEKDNVNETLKAMFNKAMNKKILKGLPDRLF